jgi:citrate synthase
MSETTDFKPGLEGVVAVETEIGEPDREGGSLRYRGVDIEELVGRVPYEKVWGLLVDESLEPGMPEPEAYEPPRLTGNAPADAQAEIARLSGVWGLRKLHEITDEQARDDLAMLSTQVMALRGWPTGTRIRFSTRWSHRAARRRRSSCSAGVERLTLRT